MKIYYAPVIQQNNLSTEQFAKQLEGQKIKAVERRGKYILFVLENGWLVCHLRMTGKLLFRENKMDKGKHDLALFELESGKIIVYEDVRKFGGFFFIQENPYEYSKLTLLGPEPLSDAFNGTTLWKTTRNRKRPVKSHILDQSIIAGIGNIYADEILFRAGIRPRKCAQRLTKKECESIAQATREVLQEAIAAGGSTIRDYVDSENREGSFQLAHRVYGRSGQKCYQCGSVLKTVTVGGRSSVYCPKCQKS